jgi:2Fe-2S ferredoxin
MNGKGVNISAGYNKNQMNKTISVHLIAHNSVTTSINAKIGKTLMEAATASNVDGIAADCGGLMTCATCHVFVDEPFASQLGRPDSEEVAMLAFTAAPRQPNSRLSCQITLTAELDGLTVKLPVTQY